MYETFILYIASPSVNSGDTIYPSKKAQIAHLKVDKAFIKVFSKDVNFAVIFLIKLVVKLLKHMKINNHAIKLVADWQ